MNRALGAEPRAPQAAVIIKSERVRAAKRRAALRTLLLPLLGAIVAVASSLLTGIGWAELAAFGVMFVWAMLGMEVGFHRLFAHRAFQTSKPLEAFWWVSGLMAGQGSGTYWLAAHRRHHAHSDGPNDPHSPLCRTGRGGAERLSGLRGLWHAHQGNTYTDYATNVVVFAADALRNPLYGKLDKQAALWVAVGLLLPAAAGWLVYHSLAGAWSCFLWGGPLRMFVQHHTYFTNASLGHVYGEQAFRTNDNSRNNWYCALWTFGGALQNTHHAFPSSAYLRQRWYELDVAGFAIRLMERGGLVWNVHRPTPEQLDAKRLART